MGERKVLNKYYPPDFDPSKIPKRKRADLRGEQIKVRMMLPMSIQCNTCGNFIYKGTKFNSSKEDVPEDMYLGIRVFRFYFKCSRCGAELTMKTDPKNSDYIVENGASRNYEPWKDSDGFAEGQADREAEEEGDAMKALENRTLDSKHEMDILSALDEMKSLNSRHAMVTTDDALAALRRQAAKEAEAGEGARGGLEEEDEEEIRKFVLNSSSGVVKRIESDSDSDGGGAGAKGGGKKAKPAAAEGADAAGGGGAFDAPAKAKGKPPVKPPPKPQAGFGVRAAGIKLAVKKKEPVAAAPGGLALLGAYGSGSDDSD